jgi:hypothetical protein
MRQGHTSLVLAAAVIVSSLLGGSAWAETIVSRHQAAQDVLVSDVRAEDGAVSGVVVNNTGHEIQNVKLLVRYDWLWANEFSPGQDSPGRAIVHTLEEDIPPGGQVPFTYHPESPLPQRSDGHFQTSVVVLGYTQFR